MTTVRQQRQERPQRPQRGRPARRRESGESNAPRSSCGYGHRLVLLETFVQLDSFSGTCYRAANWQNVGTTRGYSVRGSEARTSEPPRAIFLYPLRKDFRSKLAG